MYVCVCVYIGVLPSNYMFATMGLTISEATSLERGGLKNVLTLLFLAFMLLLPTLCKKKLAAMEEAKFTVKKKDSFSDSVTSSSSPPE